MGAAWKVFEVKTAETSQGISERMKATSPSTSERPELAGLVRIPTLVAPQ